MRRRAMLRLLHGVAMILSYSTKRAVYYCRPSFEDRHIPRNAGFDFDFNAKAWTTTSPYVAFCLRKYADDLVKDMLARMVESYGMSWATSCMFEPPVPAGCELLPYQKAGVQFALDAFTKRRSPCGSVLIADPMGL